MNYYEELDVGRHASVEEIRRAYRALACLLHPDQQREARQRRLAELQMTRLNRILEVLTDAQSRLEYDRSLDAPRRLPEGRRGRGRRLWMSALAAFAGAWAWSVGRAPSPGPPVFIPVPAAPPPAVASAAAPAARPRAHGARRAGQPTQRRPPLPPPQRRPGDEPAGALLPPAAAQDTPPPAAGAPPQPAPPHAPAFAGVWVYTPAGAPSSSARLYQPAYLEMRLVERQGLLTGSYSGRYQVNDDPRIIPAVAFAVAGRAEGARAELRWYGAGGTRGTMVLQLIGETALKVTWTADELGSQPVLASGAATLVRWREP